MIDPAPASSAADLQAFLDERGIDTRTIWTGNVTRQPMLAGVEVRVPADGLPDADDVMARGVLLPLSHATRRRHARLRDRHGRCVPRYSLTGNHVSTDGWSAASPE